MKRLAALCAIVATACAAMFAARADEAKPLRCIAGISPFLEDGVKDAVYRRMIELLAEGMPLNSSLVIFDAYNLRSIAEAQVPNARAFHTAKTRVNQFAKPIGALKQFLAAHHPRPENGAGFAGAIRLPQFMDFIAEHLLDTNSETVVILLGSPLYMDAKEPGFSMIDGAFPSDGHLMASRERSVYGLKERSGQLSGALVCLGYFGDPWVSSLHEEKVERFWSLFLEGQGARLAAFTGDLPTVFSAAAGRGPGRSRGFEPDRAQTKLEMIRITRDIARTDWITRETISNPARTAPAHLTGPMKIGIRWKGSIDIDLYARARPGAERLYFEHVRSPEGWYFKDHRSSPGREFEFIEFEQPVNISEVRAEVNFFDGRAPGGAEGEVRVEFEGRIYSGRFVIPAEHGNQGREGRGQNDWWRAVNIPRLLGLEAAEQARVQ